MADISSIALNVLGITQARTLDQINMRVFKMSLDSEKTMANLLLKNINQVQQPSNSSEGHIDIYV